MSRLDSFIRRMQGQRDCLNRAAELIAGIPGPVLELGLGNGRTYDHLKEILPDREIFVFDRRIAATFSAILMAISNWRSAARLASRSNTARRASSRVCGTSMPSWQRR